MKFDTIFKHTYSLTGFRLNYLIYVKTSQANELGLYVHFLNELQSPKVAILGVPKKVFTGTIEDFKKDFITIFNENKETIDYIALNAYEFSSKIISNALHKWVIEITKNKYTIY